MTLREDGLELSLLDDRGTHRNLVSYERVRAGEFDATVRNDFGPKVLKELHDLVR